jgi:hypothetical protein
MTPIIVKVRESGTHTARCSPGGETASSTSSAEFAVERAAAKHFGILPRRIRMHKNDDGTWAVLPESAAPKHWPTAIAIVQAHIDRMMGRSGPA